MHLIMFLSLLCMLVLGTVFFVLHTETMLEKIILSSVLAIVFLFIVIQVIIYRQALKMTIVMMKESKKLISKHIGTLLYIPFFIVIYAAFLFLIYHLYSYSLSIQPANFDKHRGLFYKVTPLLPSHTAIRLSSQFRSWASIWYGASTASGKHVTSTLSSQLLHHYRSPSPRLQARG